MVCEQNFQKRTSPYTFVAWYRSIRTTYLKGNVVENNKVMKKFTLPLFCYDNIASKSQ